MNGKTFIDTNILIYAHDADRSVKHRIARDIVDELWVDDSGAVSMQVLQEFYANATRKMRVPLSKPQARSLVDDYAVWCIETTPTEIAAAFRIEDQARIGFWDALIIAAAQKSGADRLLSEDLNSGQTIAGIRIENPFAKLA
jgi:predicted nucleic acid-binding protein